jgi:Cys-rich protein (TIGR01571 family)
MSQMTSKAAEPETVYAMQVETGKAVADIAGPSTIEELGLTTGKWEDQLCGCFSSLVPNCLMVTFCPCVALAQIAHRLNVAKYLTVLLVCGIIVALEWIMFILAIQDQASLSSDDFDDYYYYYAHRVRLYRSTNVAYQIVMYAIEIAVIVFVWHLRNLTRARFQIPGSGCEDCLVSFFCSCCSMAQVATHIKSYKAGSCDFGAPDTLPAYDCAA